MYSTILYPDVQKNAGRSAIPAHLVQRANTAHFSELIKISPKCRSQTGKNPNASRGWSSFGPDAKLVGTGGNFGHYSGQIAAVAVLDDNYLHRGSSNRFSASRRPRRRSSDLETYVEFP